MPTTEAPFWVIENETVSLLLNHFISMLDREVTTERLQLKITKAKVKTLYDFSKSDQHLADSWSLIEQDLQALDIIKQIKPKRKLAVSDETYEGATLYFNHEKEALVRSWLNRPKNLSEQILWDTAIEKSFSQTDLTFLKLESFSKPIKHQSKIAAEVVEGFCRVAYLLEQRLETKSKIDLRTISTRCFWGDSKFLDDRLDLIFSLFENAIEIVIPRQLVFLVSIPKVIKDVVFVENLDTFRNLADLVEQHETSQLAVVYSAGYKITAKRTRRHGNCKFINLNVEHDASMEHFLSWWYEKSEASINSYFWGDLDFEGLAILKDIRAVFTHTEAWQPGYNAMLKYHHNGLGHCLDDAGKQNQNQPSDIGCHFAETILLEAMKTSNRFLDQEVLCIEELNELLDK